MRNRWMLRLKPIVALLLSITMIILITGCKKEETLLNEQSMVAMDANDAITQLANAEADYGYENALSELTEKSSATIDGDSYYRLQQNYQGIPVYGRTVVCATDGDGKITSITGNTFDVDSYIDLVPAVTDNEVYNSIRAYTTDVLHMNDALVSIPALSDDYLVIYIQSAGQSALAFQLIVFVGEESYRVVVDAHTAVIYEMSSLVLTETLTIQYYLDANVKSVDLNLWVEDGEYSFYDQERNITLYSANGETLVRYFIFYDTNDKICYYHYPTQNLWLNPEKETITQPASDYAYVRYGFETSEQVNGVSAVTASSLDELPADAYETMAYLANVNDFFAECLDRDGWANDYTQLLPVVYDCSNGSYASHDRGIAMISLKTGSGLNTASHEFMHTVEQSESAMIYSGESGAIMEALSDIYSEVSEHYYYQSCDWLYDGGVRNLINPALSTEGGMSHPSTYLGDHWIDTSDDWDNGGVHINSTVISHAAYLMSESGGGLLSMDDLAKLWYRAMLMMPSDCNFHDCRKLVELAATSMELTTAQIECVSEAFDAVGITGTTKESFDALYDLALDSTLSVYGGDGELYDNYTLNITGNTTIYGPVIEKVDSSYNRTRTITTAEPYDLDLPQGIYVFTITDNANPSVTSSFTVCVWNNDGDANLNIFTNFGGTPVKGTVSEIKKDNGAETNIPINDAVVSVYSHAEETVVDTINMTETEGFFEVYLPAGSYSLFAEAEGYVSSTVSFEVGFEEIYLPIILEPENGTETYGSFASVIEDVQNRINYNSYSASQKEYCRGDFFEIDGREALVLMYYASNSPDLDPGYYTGLWIENADGTISCLTDQLIEEVGDPDDAYVTVNIRKIDGKMYLNPYVRTTNGNTDISKNQYYLIGDELVLEYDLQSEAPFVSMGDGLIQHDDSESVYYLNQEQIDRSTFYSTQDKLNIRTFILGLNPNWSEGRPPQGYTFEELLA